ncbi:MAG TPA: hypothetical protein VFD70_15735 [Anaerolineae bacterium]|nr:hypothetical protein [Anaerolineae bacterium]
MTVLIQLVSLGWLEWQSDLRGNTGDALNAIVTLIAVEAFVALLVISLLVLFVRDASVWALGIVYVACPLGMVVLMSLYPTEPQLKALASPSSLLVNLSTCLITFLAVFGAIAFVVNFMRLLYGEFSRRPLR